MTQKPPKPPIQPLRDDQKVQHGVSSEQYELIGRAIVGWANLEAVMQDLLWEVLGVSMDDGRVFTQRADATKKIQWLRTFASRKAKEADLTKLLLALQQIESLQSDRNFIAHGTWATLIPQNVPLASSVREKSDQPDQVVAETFEKDRMNAIIHNIEVAKLHLLDWRNSILLSRQKST